MTGREKTPILVVDDDPAIRAALERLLRNEFNLALAPDLETARRLIGRTQFDLALVDLHLGSETSLDFLRDLQTSSPTTVRVLVSGDLHLNSLVDSLEANLIHKVLQKPWEPSSLILQIKEAQQIHSLLKQQKHLEQLSTTDALTGLYNFRYLQQRLPQEIERAKRSNRPLSLVMVDIDHFKKFNDTNGHVQGDQLIRMVSEDFKNNLRTFDCICRYGGDEFCILLQETSLTTAVDIAERLRKQVALSGLLTISLGIANFPQTSLDMDRLLTDADAALYTAKNQGRNRCVIAADFLPR